MEDETRKLLRIGEFAYVDGEVKVRDIVRYDYASGKWRYPEPFSRKATLRMEKYDPAGCRRLEAIGMIERC